MRGRPAPITSGSASGAELVEGVGCGVKDKTDDVECLCLATFSSRSCKEIKFLDLTQNLIPNGTADVV